MRIDPERIATSYYFGDLQYWKLPSIAAVALEEGFDGPALRRLAGLMNLGKGEIREEDIAASEVACAFREMGVDAPFEKRKAQMILARECAIKVVEGKESVFDAATYVQIHLCHLSEPPEALKRIVQLSNYAKHAPRTEWLRLEGDLKDAFSIFLTQADAARRLAVLGGTDPAAEAAPRRRVEGDPCAIHDTLEG